MQMKDRTKTMFADMLEQMLLTTPMEKVRVSRLCELCGATTPTFYYYFHDKYELVAWIFLKDFAGEFDDKEPGYSAERLYSLTKRMENHKTFYKKAFSDRSQNSISEYVQAFNLQIAEDAVMHMTGESSLTEDQRRDVKYHVYGIMGMFGEWLNEEIATEQMTQFLYDKTPGFLKSAFAVYPYFAEAILQKSGNTKKPPLEN